MRALSIVIPLRNEWELIGEQAQYWRTLQASGVELCFVDGSSQDKSQERLCELGFRVLSSPAGRAVQMNLGARAVSGELLIFLHADTVLPLEALAELSEVLATRPELWGRFDLQILGSSLWFPLISFMINLRSRLTGIATGDQTIFVTRKLFETIGAFPDQPLMEDIEISKRLLAIQKPLCLRRRVLSSGRRWEKFGVWRTIFLMWSLRWSYWRGSSAEELKRRYI